MKRRATALNLGVGLGLLLLATGLSAQGQEAAPPKPPFPLQDPQRINAGKLRFGATCAAYCHGSEGRGGKAPAFRGRNDFAPAEAFSVISQGRRGADIMPPWGNAFSPDEIWELVAYLQHLSTLPP
ncbi:c-type cytochrome [Roseateles sp. BYS180W]|uniref:C-type cytochrome n=1 Tax=Roseateles rivi TaxID=3299028 RepID=A0ABW7FSP4_9BURK